LIIWHVVVGHIVASSDEKDPLSAVGCADIASCQYDRPAGVVFRFKVAEDGIRSARQQTGHVLADNPPWPQLADEPIVFGP
jgi:hypothetical protein